MYTDHLSTIKKVSHISSHAVAFTHALLAVAGCAKDVVHNQSRIFGLQPKVCDELVQLFHGISLQVPKFMVPTNWMI